MQFQSDISPKCYENKRREKLQKNEKYTIKELESLLDQVRNALNHD